MDIEKSEEEKNIDEVLEIMKNSYNQYYERSQDIDNKSGFLIAFHSAIIIFALDIESIKNLLELQCQNIGQILSNIISILLTCIILILAMISISLFILSLKSRTIKYIPANICDEKYYKSKNIDLKKELLKSYKEISQNNEKVINKKHTMYNIALIITLIEIILIGINIFFEIFH